MFRILYLVLVSCVFVPSPLLAQANPGVKELLPEVRKNLDRHFDELSGLYKHLHAHPELSYQEQATAARLAEEMRKIGFDVTEKVGGHGIVCVLKNGKGPTILVRTDLDGLPVTENTGLPYASQVRVRDGDGKQVGTMHACGHDMHMTCWTGTARVLANLKDKWKGTLVFIGQPAEERGAGARAMLEDGLYKRFPKPDYALALHCDNVTAAGSVSFTDGLALANVDTVDILVRGKGGHGAAPHTTIDPIVIAARIVLDVQTIVSREIDPLDSAVVTVGAIHGGTKHNIIPAEVKLQLTVRSFKDSVRKHLLEAIERKAKAAALSAQAPEPIMKIDIAEFTPALHNDPVLTKRTVGTLKEILGAEKVLTKPPIMGGEDFSRYAREGVPIFMFWLGTANPEKLKLHIRGEKPVPAMHSDGYYPELEPSLRTGVTAMSSAVLDLLLNK